MSRLSIGARAADWVASTVGSWRFILIQSAALTTWIVWNVLHPTSFDPYPFILLNLVLSFQAAYTGPIVMMAANRAADRDRKKAEKDYHVNVKAESEIQTLHHKLDLMKEKEMKELIEIINTLVTRMPV